MNITRAQARRFLLMKQGLYGKRRFSGIEGILKFVGQAGCIQFDPIDICGKNHELVLQSRIEGFQPEMLYGLLYKERKLVDYWDKNMSILRIEDWPYLERRRIHSAISHRNSQSIQEAGRQLKQHILESGPICSTDVDMGKKVDWFWAPTSVARAALEALFFSGELGIHHKRNTKRYYEVMEKLLPKDILEAGDPNESDQDHYTWYAERRIGAVGMLAERASDAFLGIYGMKSAHRKEAFRRLQEIGRILPVTLEETGQVYYIQAGDLELMKKAGQDRGAGKKRLEFIAPLDNLIWDRRLIQELFDFDYKWEIYTPEKERKYGYYILPVLYGDRFIGRIEILRDRKIRELWASRLWLEKGVRKTAALQESLEDALHNFAAFNKCKYRVDKVFETVLDSKR